MAQEDLAINRSVRKVLVRHWIDLGRVSISSVSGNVTIKGGLHLLRGVKHELEARIVESIFHDIKRITGVKRTSTDLENWAFIDGAWRHLSARKDDEVHFDKGPDTVYEI